MTITDHEMHRRQLVARAGSYLLDAMVKFTEDHAELTFCEWLKAVNDAIVQRALARELADEWREEK